MKVTILMALSVLGLFFLSSCAYEEQTIPQSPKIYIADGSGSIELTDLEKPKTFVVVEQDNSVWLWEDAKKRSDLNKIRALRDFEDKQEELSYESQYRNVKRIVDDELVVGYVKELDNPEFKEVE